MNEICAVGDNQFAVLDLEDYNAQKSDSVDSGGAANLQEAVSTLMDFIDNNL